MGLRDGIELGLSLSNAYNQDLYQRADAERRQADAAYQEEARQRQRGQWAAVDQAGQSAIQRIAQAGINNKIAATDAGFAAPERDPRVLRQGGYGSVSTGADGSDQYTEGQQAEKLSFGPQYEAGLEMLREKAKLAQASGDSNALLSVGNELKALQMGAGATAIRNRILSASPDEVAKMAKQISDDKRNGWQMKTDPKTGITTVSNGGPAVPLSQSQLGDLVSARWRLKQGDETAAQDIAKVHESLAGKDKEQLETFRGLAQTNNGAATAANGIQMQGAHLRLAQNADKRAGAEFDAGAPTRQLNSTLGTLQLGLANTSDPTERAAIQEKINAIQGGIGAGKEQPAEVKLASAMVKAGMYPDMRTALEVAITKKGQSADEIHQGFVQAGIKNMMPADQSVSKADEAMAAMGYTKKGGRWTQGAGAADTVAKFGTAADAEAAAKAGKLKPGDKVEINGRTATYKP